MGCLGMCNYGVCEYMWDWCKQVGEGGLNYERVANDMRKPHVSYRQEKNQLILDAYDKTTHYSKLHDAMII